MCPIGRSACLRGRTAPKPLGSSMTRPVFWITTTVLIMCAAFNPTTSGAQERHFNNITVFGDSLSDTGNAAGARFSNGPVWVEHIARHFGLSVDPVNGG